MSDVPGDNARLREAAPELLAALHDALWAIDNMDAILIAHNLTGTIADPRPRMRAAISKAEGRS